MKKCVALTTTILAISACALAGCKKEQPQKVEAPAASSTSTGAPRVTGEQLFKQFCAACHPDGGNVVNPQKTLHSAVLADNKIKTAADLEKILRNPGPGMRKFEPSMVSSREAELIYEYVVSTFR